MAIPSELQALIERINQELARIEQETTQGLNLVRVRLSLFPNNAILNQYFAYFSTALFFVETSRRQIESTIETISPLEVPNAVVQEAAEDLGSLLGRVLEVKIKVERLITRLE